jgi:hypothetical protein
MPLGTSAEPPSSAGVSLGFSPQPGLEQLRAGGPAIEIAVLTGIED